MKNNHQLIKRNRKAVITLIAGILSISYCILLINSLWLSLSVLDIDTILLFPVFFLGSLAITFGYFSIRKIKFSEGVIQGKTSSKLGIALGFLSFVFLLLPKFVFIVYSITNPPNYEVVLQLQETPTKKITESRLKETERIVSSRLKYYAVPYKVKISAPDKLIVQFTVLDTFKEEKLQKLFGTNLLSFHLVHQDNEKLVEQTSTQDFNNPQGFKPVANGNKILFIESEPILVDNVVDAKVNFDESAHPYISVNFTTEGTKLLYRITKENVGRRLAIMLDEQLYSAPTIREPIAGGRIYIEGKFTTEEARDFAAVIQSGAGPLPTRIIENHYIS